MDNQVEIWKDIPNYEGLYQVSNLGNVKSLERFYKHRNRSLVFKKEKILKLILQKQGYYLINLFKDSKSNLSRVNRLVAIAFIPNPENKPQVNHINGIKNDNRVENLEWATSSENCIHAIKTGLQKIKIGDKCDWSKLTEKQVLLIRRLHRINPKTNRNTIAKKYNVTKATINSVISRKNWRHI